MPLFKLFRGICLSKKLVFLVVFLVLLFLAYFWVTKFGLSLPPLEDSCLLLNKDAWFLVVVGLIATVIALTSLFMEFKLSSPITFVGWVLYFPVLFNTLIPMFVLFFSVIGIFYTPWLIFTDIPFFNELINGVIRFPDYSVHAAMDYLGYILVVAGLLIYTIGLYQILSHTAKKRTLLTKGLYAIVRHPQYLGICIWTLGFAILRWRLINYMMWLTLCYSYILLAEHEELDLIKVFDQAYIQYRNRVPFLVPYPLSIVLKPCNILGSKLKLRLLIYAIVYIILLLTFYYILKPYVVMYR